MSTVRAKSEPPASLGTVLRQGRDALRERRGLKKLANDTIARELGENYGIGTTGETVRAYHLDQGGEKKNALLIAGLVDLYGLKASDLPAEEAERIGRALRLLRRVTSRRTPPGTRTRNLQNTGGRQHPSSARFVTKDSGISQVEAA